jgi:hypothetical protein
MVRRSVWLVWALMLAIAPGVRAQSVAVAQLSGTVTDESGGMLPGVDVTVTQTDTGMTRRAVTGANGEYVFTNLPVGPYKLSSNLSGFSPFEQTGIVLAVGDTRSVNVTMKIGGLSETVRVQADAALVETRNVDVGTVVSHEQIVSLPLNGRSALQLIVLSGSAVENTTLTDNRQYPNAVDISVAGGTGNSTMYLVDGGYNNDPQNNTGNPMPFPDALQEFKTESGVRNARYGMSTGATVNAVTKSGTNMMHGGLFDFVRDHTFNSIRFFERKENGGLGRDDGLKRNQAGGTLGGPLIKDKLFFFGGVQVTNTRIAPLATTQTVPTQDVRNGDFTRIMSAACRGGTARTLGAPFVNNRIDPSLYNPISLKLMSMLPLPDPAIDPDGCGRYVLQIPNNSDEQQYIGRLDYQMTQNDRFFGRVFHTQYLHPPQFDQNNPNLLLMSGAGLGNDARMTTMATGFDKVVSDNLVFSTRVTLQHTATLRIQGDGVPTWTKLGVNTFQYTNGKNGQDLLAGGTAGWSGSGFTGAFYVLTPSIAQDIDWVKGAHSISLGGVWTRPHTDGDGTFQANGNFGFTGLMTSGTSNANGGLNMADFVLGYPSTFRQGGTQLNNQSIHAIGLYAGDVWRAGRKLTLNYGIRWEPYIAAKDANGFNTAFIRENFDKGIRSVVYPNAPIGLVFAGDPGFPDNGSNNSNNYLQFAPRAGVVWDPAGDNRQTIRAGIGHYYDSPKLWQYAHHMLNPPFGNTVNAVPPTNCGVPNRNGCPIPFDDPWAFTPGGNPLVNYFHQGEPATLPDKNVTFPTQGAYVSMPVDVTPMQVTQWNLSYQRQFLRSMMFDVTYMGNQTTHIWSGYEENPAVYIPGNCEAGQYALRAPGPCSNNTAANMQARALLTLLNPTEGPFYGVNDVAQTFDDARGWYNGVRFGLQKRLSDGWSISSNYTLSKCTNEGEPGTDINNQFPVPITDITSSHPRPDTSTNKGPCVADRRHNFNMSAILVSPGLGQGILRSVTRDWQAGIIWQARSGSPITPTASGNAALTGLPQRPMIVPGVDPYLPDDQRTLENTGGAPSLAWFNLDAFELNGPGVWGNVPKGYLFGPGFWNVDASFSRNISVGEHRFEIRVEAFNLFDHVNWANPAVQIGSTSLTNGRVTNTAGDPRIMQFALKYEF